MKLVSPDDFVSAHVLVAGDPPAIDNVGALCWNLDVARYLDWVLGVSLVLRAMALGVMDSTLFLKCFILFACMAFLASILI